MPEFGERAFGAHHNTHENGGSDEVLVTGLSGELADDQPSAWAKVSGKPSTFPPDLHVSEHQNGGGDELNVVGLSGQLADDQPSTWSMVSDKPKLWQKIAEGILNADATTITISGLDGNSHEYYRIFVYIVNHYNGLCAYQVRPNGDTTTQSTQYWERWFAGQAGRSRTEPAYGIGHHGLNESKFVDLLIDAKSGKARLGFVNSARSYPAVVIAASMWANTTSNITSLVIFAEQVNGLGAGTHYTLFGLV